MRKVSVITDFVHQRLPEDFRRLLVQLMISAAETSANMGVRNTFVVNKFM